MMYCTRVDGNGRPCYPCVLSGLAFHTACCVVLCVLLQCRYNKMSSAKDFSIKTDAEKSAILGTKFNKTDNEEEESKGKKSKKKKDKKEKIEKRNKEQLSSSLKKRKTSGDDDDDDTSVESLKKKKKKKKKKLQQEEEE